MRQQINKGQTHYHPNSLGGGCPFQAKVSDGGFESYPEKVEGAKVRQRSKSFKDHFSQATLFFNSQTSVEQQHIIEALQFELGKVKTPEIRERMVGILSKINDRLASEVANALGMKKVPKPAKPINQGVPPDADPDIYQPGDSNPSLEKSEPLSLMYHTSDSIRTRQVALMCSDGVSGASIKAAKKALGKEGAYVKIVVTHQGNITTAEGDELGVDDTFLTGAPVLYDAFIIPAGKKSVKRLSGDPMVMEFLQLAFRHLKPILAEGEATQLLDHPLFGDAAKAGTDKSGIIASDKMSSDLSAFANLMRGHKVWSRLDLL
jgi:catalase